MYRAALRSTSRAARGPTPRALVRVAPRRFASTQAPSDRPRSWKSSALRWGLAFGAVYYYSTGSAFADEAPDATALIPAPSPFSESDLPTVDAVIEEKRRQARPSASQASGPEQATPSPGSDAPESAPGPGSPEALEQEAGQEGAFNPETGEINWDCPCLGGMAQGPCGEEFKTAFSCFVYSNEEPKGMDCIEKFQGMQECFRKYPEIYGAELADDEQPEQADDAAQPLAPETTALQDKQKPLQPPAPETAAPRDEEAASKPDEKETRAPQGGEKPVQRPARDTVATRDREHASQRPETDNRKLHDDVTDVGPATRDPESQARPKWMDATDANDAAKAGHDKKPA